MPKQEDLIPLYFQMFTEISIIEHLSRNRLERVLPAGLSSAQFGVLNHFVRLGGAWSPARLATAFQVTKSTMTNTIQRLEAQGFVRITPDPDDARAKLIVITEAGRKIREKAVRAAGALMVDLFQLVPASGVRAVIPFLEQLRKTLDANR